MTNQGWICPKCQKANAPWVSGGMMRRALVVLAVLGLAGWLAACKMTCAQAQQAVQLARMVGADAVAEAIKALTDTFPDGSCPVPEPPAPPPITTPPVTDPPAPPPTTLPSTPPPTPPPAGCVLAGNPTEALPETYQPQHKDAVLAAIRRAHPSCTFGTCLINEYTQQTFQAKVEAEIRKGGSGFDPLCAGQHLKSTDEIAVAGVASEPWEGYDVFTGDDSGIVPTPAGEPRRTIVWAVYKGAWYPPGPQPPPIAPTPDPQTAACPAPRWETYRDPGDAQSCTFQWGEMKVGRQWIDSTLQVRRCHGFCAAIGLGIMPDGHSPRGVCPLRNEDKYDEHLACDAEVGQLWQVRGGTLVPNPANPALANCEGPGCQVRICTKNGVCSEWKP